jgi:hypothetical protein
LFFLIASIFIGCAPTRENSNQTEEFSSTKRYIATWNWKEGELIVVLSKNPSKVAEKIKLKDSCIAIELPNGIIKEIKYFTCYGFGGFDSIEDNIMFREKIGYVENCRLVIKLNNGNQIMQKATKYGTIYFEDEQIEMKSLKK